MNERALNLYGIGGRGSKMPSTGVIGWGLLVGVAWIFALVQLLLFHDIPGFVVTAVVALIFAVFLGLAQYSSKRTGLKC